MQENPSGNINNSSDEEKETEDEYVVEPIEEAELQNHPDSMQIFVRSPYTGGGLKTLNVLSSSSLAQIVELLLRRVDIPCPSGMCVLLRTGTKSLLTVGEDGLRTLEIEG